jgi:hypothetical protein
MRQRLWRAVKFAIIGYIVGLAFVCYISGTCGGGWGGGLQDFIGNPWATLLAIPCFLAGLLWP